jgi:hypothetical protein
MITKKTDLAVWLFHAHGLIEYKGIVTKAELQQICSCLRPDFNEDLV